MLGGGARPAEPKHPLVMATLRVETNGEYAGAVRVFVGDREVGSIPKNAAETYSAVVEEVEVTTGPATCRGRVIGGGLSYEGDFWLSFGFELLQPTKPRAAQPMTHSCRQQVSSRCYSTRARSDT